MTRRLLVLLCMLITSACTVSVTGPSRNSGSSSGSQPTATPVITGSPTRQATSATSTPPNPPNTSSSTPPNPSDASSSATVWQPSLAAAQETLKQYLRNGEQEYVIALSSGYDGLLYDNVGHLRFFGSVTGQYWTESQDATYYYDPRDAAGQQLKVAGAQLTGMDDATYVLHGIFSGDGSGNAMAYAYASNHWGPLVGPGLPSAKNFGVLAVGESKPSPSDNQDFVFHDLYFSNGDLVQTDCDFNQTPTAECGAPGTLIVSRFRWNGSAQEFEVVS